jgi:hypothetical protein
VVGGITVWNSEFNNYFCVPIERFRYQIVRWSMRWTGLAAGTEGALARTLRCGEKRCRTVSSRISKARIAFDEPLSCQRRLIIRARISAACKAEQSQPIQRKIIIMKLTTSSAVAALIGAAMFVAASAPAHAARCQYIAHKPNGVYLTGSIIHAFKMKNACKRARNICNRRLDRKSRQGKAARGVKCVRRT